MNFKIVRTLNGNKQRLQVGALLVSIDGSASKYPLIKASLRRLELNTAVLSTITPSPAYVADVVNRRHRLSDAELHRRAVLRQEIEVCWSERTGDVVWTSITDTRITDVYSMSLPPAPVVLDDRRLRSLTDIRQGIVCKLLSRAERRLQAQLARRKNGRPRFLNRKEHQQNQAGNVFRIERNTKLTRAQRGKRKANKQRIVRRRIVRPGRELMPA